MERTAIDVHLPLEIHDELDSIDQYTQCMWQEIYSASKAGQDYRNLEPVVNSKIKFTSSTRRKENVITRLRFGKCNLNKYLFDMKLHPDGLCEKCKMPETIRHLLLECQTTGIPAQLTNKCLELHLDPTLENLLSNTVLQDLVFNLILSTNRSV